MAMGTTSVLPLRDDSDRARSVTIQEVRHTCSRMMFIVRRNGIELRCDKCGSTVLYTWREILTMMLTAELAHS